jgi:hypothetical protein
MDNSTQDNLCKGLRACGIPKKQAHQILNEITKWYDRSGKEWTNSRIKDLRQWYETTIAGTPAPPEWFKHSDDNMPLGIWKWVFELPKAKALGVLSLNTVFYETKLSEKQEEKFLHALSGSGTQDEGLIDTWCKHRLSPKAQQKYTPKTLDPIRFPTVFDMTGSIPVHNCQNSVRPGDSLGAALEALRLSWEDVPQVTFDFLDRQNLLGYMPVSVIGNDYQLELNRPHNRYVGRVSVLQQPQLKARIVGNPNRVMQVTLEPLKALYMSAARKLPTDVTFNQDSGVKWVQDKLKQHIEVAGSDLTSASDLLDVRLSLKLVDRFFGFPRIPEYEEYEDYFYEVSRSTWFCPALDRDVKWEQGNVLGTGPSFGLLTLTNNVAACNAFYIARANGHLLDVPWYDAFRVVGDDIVMLAPMEPYYTEIIRALGGEINSTKTLKSNRCAEFAGRVITAEGVYLKALKYSEPSDNSFMSYMAQLGDQAKFLLRPKQRKVYDLLKAVPGVAVDGPWMMDSYGVPLSDRYQWYLEEVQPALEAAEPDQIREDYSITLLKAQLSLAEAGKATDLANQFDEPFLVDEGYLPSQVTPSFKVGGDPRLTDGKSQLDVLFQHLVDKDITPFEVWLQQQSSLSSNGEDKIAESTISSDDSEARDRKESLCPADEQGPKSSDMDSDHYETLTEAVKQLSAPVHQDVADDELSR